MNTWLVRTFLAFAASLLTSAPCSFGDTTITGWGDNSTGQITISGDLTNAVQIAAGGGHSMALLADGTVLVWGDNSFGQTNVPAGLNNVLSVAAGRDHCVALRSDGTIVIWGGDGWGQTDMPPGLSNVVAIATGLLHNLALRADGTVVGWGWNPYGESIAPRDLTNVIAVAGGEMHSMALLDNHTVFTWGDVSAPFDQVPSDLTNAVAITAGQYYSEALRDDGTVVTWGSNPYTDLTVPAGLSNVVAIAGGEMHSLALRDDGTVVAWGSGTPGSFGFYDHAQATVPNGLSNVTAISAGTFHSLAISGSFPPFITTPMFPQTVLADASAVFRIGVAGNPPFAYQWQVNGGDLPGQTSDSLVLPHVSMTQSGNAYSINITNSAGGVTSGSILLTVVPLILTTNPFSQVVLAGTNLVLSVDCRSLLPVSYQWQMNGTNLPGEINNTLLLTNITLSQLGNYSAVVNNSAGTVPTTNALLTVVPLIIRTNPLSQRVIPGGSVTFAANCLSLLPVTYQWQFNGAILPGATNSTLVLSNLTSDQAGSYSVLISNDAGTVPSSNAVLSFLPLVAWGANTSGQANIPLSLTEAVQVAAGYSHNLALRPDGTVVAWGYNFNGQANVPIGLSNVIDIAAGQYHNLALRADGTVIGWGSNFNGQTNVPAGLTNVVAIAAGASHSLALRANGTVAGWGSSSKGERFPPSGLSNVVAIAAGNYFSLALQASGTVVAWGDNTYGVRTVPAGLNDVVGIAAGYTSCLALRSDGTLVPWGRWEDASFRIVPMTVPAGLSNVVRVAIGSSHALALRADGSVVAWGLNTDKQTNAPAGLANVSGIAAGYAHSLAIFGGPPVTQALAANPTLTGLAFSLEIPTQNGRVYALEYKSSLEAPLWTPLPLSPGNGALQTLVDASASTNSGFYRVRAW